MVQPPIAEVIRELRAWRERNDLSQAQAAAVLVTGGVPVVLATLRRWEIGYRRPGPMAAKLLEDFLKRHPKVKKKGKGRYGSRAKPAVPAKVVKRILAMRAGGETLRAIGREVGLSESAVSRICSGSRHGKHGK